MAVPLGRAPWSSFLRFHLHTAGAHRQTSGLSVSLSTREQSHGIICLFFSLYHQLGPRFHLQACTRWSAGRRRREGDRAGNARCLDLAVSNRELSHKSKRASVGHGQQSDPSAAHVHLGTATRYGKRGLGHRQVILLWSWGRRGVGGGRSRCACPLSSPQRHRRRRRRRHRLRT